MAKVIAWIILIFVVLLALRMINMHNARKRARAEGAAKLGEPMVRCLKCGIFLPRSDAREVDGGFACASGTCVVKS